MKTKMYISCILALMITAAAWAVEGLEGPSSPSKAAAKLNGTEADQFMSLTEWSNVKFDKLFTYAGFDQKSRNAVDLGAAFKAGPVYIGAWYEGMFGKVDNKDDRSVETARTGTVPGWFDGTTRKYGTQVTEVRDADHKAAVLIGFGNMGVRLGYARSKANKSGTYYGGVPERNSTQTNSKTPGVVTGDTTYDPKGYVNDAERTPSIDFGMNLAVGSLSIAPAVGFALKIDQNSEYGRQTVKTENKTAKTHTIMVNGKGKNNTVMTVMGKLGADIGLNDSLHSTFSVGYDLGVGIYGKKKHTASDGSTKELLNGYAIVKDEHTDIQTATMRDVTNAFHAKKFDKSRIDNTITLGYAMQKDFTDRLSFFAGVEAPITFNFEAVKTSEENKKVEKHTDLVNKLNDHVKTTTVTTPTETKKTTTVGFNPALKAAITYALIPNRIFLNFGAQVQPFGKDGYEYKTVKTTYDGFIKTTTTTDKYTNDSARIVPDRTDRDNAPATESSVQTATYTKAQVDVHVGVRWDIIDAISFDVMYNKSILEEIQWTKIGNLKLACTIKF